MICNRLLTVEFCKLFEILIGQLHLFISTQQPVTAETEHNVWYGVYPVFYTKIPIKLKGGVKGTSDTNVNNNFFFLKKLLKLH